MISCLYDCFKHWASTGDVKLISDPHFCDDDCKIMDECWPAPEEYLDYVNRHVQKGETLIILGDCGCPEFISKINGYKVLITGNHDKAYKYKDVVDEIYQGPLFIAPKILLSHEPVCCLDWCLNIHGHVHDGEMCWEDFWGAPHLNICSNVVDWRVLSLGKLIKNGVLKDITGLHRQTIDRAGKEKENE